MGIGDLGEGFADFWGSESNLPVGGELLHLVGGDGVDHADHIGAHSVGKEAMLGWRGRGS